MPRTDIRLIVALLAATIFASGLGAAAATAPGVVKSIAVLDFELKDLTLDPNSPAQRQQTAALKPLLEHALAARHCRVAAVDVATQEAADKGAGYLFDHPDAAAALGRAAGADWVVVGRLHKASFLFVYLKVHLIEVRTEQQRADLVVEVKGSQQRLAEHGIDSLADQIVDAIAR